MIDLPHWWVVYMQAYPWVGLLYIAVYFFYEGRGHFYLNGMPDWDMWLPVITVAFIPMLQVFCLVGLCAVWVMEYHVNKTLKELDEKEPDG